MASSTNPRSGNWKDILRAQHEELNNLASGGRRGDEADDRENIVTEELDEQQITADIDRLLRRQPLTSSYVSKAVKNSFTLANEMESGRGYAGNNVGSTARRVSAAVEPVDLGFGLDDENDLNIEAAVSPSSARSGSRGKRPSSGNARTAAAATAANEHLPSGDLPADTQLRFLTAKVKMLSKQVDDTNEVRRELGEQCADLQRQLKTEREENKNLKKRYCAFGVA
jgi:hypothetical protein